MFIVLFVNYIEIEGQRSLIVACRKRQAACIEYQNILFSAATITHTHTQIRKGI